MSNIQDLIDNLQFWLLVIRARIIALSAHMSVIVVGKRNDLDKRWTVRKRRSWHPLCPHVCSDSYNHLSVTRFVFSYLACIDFYSLPELYDLENLFLILYLCCIWVTSATLYKWGLTSSSGQNLDPLCPTLIGSTAHPPVMQCFPHYFYLFVSIFFRILILFAQPWLAAGPTHQRSILIV